jgi:hypothetical protein
VSHSAWLIAGKYRLERPAAPLEGSEVRLWLADGVRIARSGSGEQLLYRGHLDYGMPLEAALALGWCSVGHPCEDGADGDEAGPEPKSAPVAG